MSDRPRSLAPDAVGTWSLDVPDDRWTWSPAVYACLGFSPGEVVPSTGLLLAHLDDHAGVSMLRDGLVELVRRGEPFARHLVVRDARSRRRSLLVVGRGADRTNGRVREVHGYVVDLTSWRRHTSEADIRSGIEAASEYRSEIDQAKGALMALHGLTADAAFEALVRASQRYNVKVRELAHRLVASLSGNGGRRAGAPGVDDLLGSLC